MYTVTVVSLVTVGVALLFKHVILKVANGFPPVTEQFNLSASVSTTCIVEPFP
jgi:hypothetical protein